MLRPAETTNAEKVEAEEENLLPAFQPVGEQVPKEQPVVRDGQVQQLLRGQ